ncbi:MAG: thioesterase family protein [Microthrixaceae bacterium]|nr:thioesterase family protein [Microthrixaceae bacterium]
MDAVAWLGLEPTEDPMRWRLPVTPGISTMGNFLFGGCALGAAIGAMQGATGRPIVWATAQYLSYARPGSVLDIDLTVPQAGRQTTQARAVGHVGDTEILTVNAALGSRPLELSGQWAERPDVPPPDECPPRGYRAEHADTLMARLDQRLAVGREMDQLDGTPTEDGRCALWVRMPELLEMSGAALAILGDYVPFGIGQALGQRAGGNSLDNTLRLERLVPTEWVLLDIRVHAVAHGYGHGLVHLWAEDGTLLATASQSTIVRFWEDPK